MGPGGTRGPSYKKRVMLDHYRGTARARSWPRARGGKLDPKTKAQMEWFRIAQWATKWWAADFQIPIMRATKGSPLMPRDIMTMIMAGRAYSVTINGYGTIYPMAAVTEVSKSLDVIGQTPGDMMARGPTAWESIPGGLVGYVLTSNGPNVAPGWAPSTGGGGGGYFNGMAALPSGAVDGIASATKGFAIMPRERMSLTSILVRASDPGVNTTYFAQISTINTSTGAIIEVLATSDPVVVAASGVRNFRIPFSVQPELEPATAYLVSVTRDGGTGTTSVSISGITSGEPLGPYDIIATQRRYSTIGLTNGQAQNSSSGGAYYTIVPEGRLVA